MDENRFEELPADSEPTPSPPQKDSSDPLPPDRRDEELDPLEEMLREANSLKELGNAEFQKKLWQAALLKYSEALAVLPLKPTPKLSTKLDQDPLQDGFLDDDKTLDKEPHTNNSESHPVSQCQEEPDSSSPPAPIQSSDDARISRLRSILNANTAACHLKMEDWQSAVQASEASLKDDPNYVKAFHRRAQANEKLGTWASLQASLDDYNAISKLPDIPHGLTKEVKMGQARLPPLIAQRAETDKAEMMAKLKDLGNTVLGKFGMSTDNFKFTPNESGGYSMSFQQ
ncbi:hypothetical protein PCANC_19270 [Puccinia coronata f. sp. avenae]|uniref:Uncharacterized protein n=1 Tax=Puccinia coronata f. sp. avenae TaxID=200324 RepID=A0A2N5UBU7_9BASI|nr:hypothetical protein PCANC_19270 [Puccinia coronata f. sp. avenae]